MLSQQNGKILVAEDTENDRVFIRSVLRSAGYEPLIYPGLVEGRWHEDITANFAQWEPEVLLLSSRFGEVGKVDTRKLITRLKADPGFNHIPILMLSELAPGEITPSAIDWGADGFVVKPLNRLKLLAAIENLQTIHRRHEGSQSHSIPTSKIDFRTDLPNRPGFEEVLKARCSASKCNDHFYLVRMDTDNFQQINGSLGHSLGDTLIACLARRITGALDKIEGIAHLGAGSFALILEVDENALRLSLQTMSELLATRFIIAGKEFYLTYSQGVAGFPADGHDWQILLKQAEIELYQMKQKKRDALCYF